MKQIVKEKYPIVFNLTCVDIEDHEPLILALRVVGKRLKWLGFRDIHGCERVDDVLAEAELFLKEKLLYNENKT